MKSVLILFSLSLTLPAPLEAFDFQVGDLDARLDTTLVVGGTYRLHGRNPELIGLAHGGRQYSVNADDGNLNYDPGWVSFAGSLTSDLELRLERMSGAFFRVNAFYDYINKQRERARNPLSSEAMDRVGARIDMLDAYLWHNFQAGEVPVNLRLGRQVLNWGESTFIQNGINTINPVDVSKIRVPGAEIREALLPVWMASISASPTEFITLEAFYQFRWKEVIIDPPGTYFSNNDFVGRGGERVYLGFGSIADNSPIGFIPRGPDNRPSNSGQFGAAVRYLSPRINNTEFGLFFTNTHSRLPVISARTPRTPINTNLTGPLTMVFMQAGLPSAQASAQAAAIFQLLVLLNTQGPGALTPEQLATIQAPQTQAAIAGAQQIAFLQSAATGRYLIEYPEDIRLFGVSFNTDLGTTGVSLQGELSYRRRVPLQVDDVELLFAAVSAINPAFGVFNQIGNFAGQLDTYISGFRRHSVWQGQFTATKVLGPTFGADQWIVLVEPGFTYVAGLPRKSVLRYDGPGTFTGGNPAATSAGLQPATEPGRAFADPMSWGYRVVTRLDYNNLFYSVNASPSLQFAHDVSGNTPLPLGNFLRGRKAVTAAMDFNYQHAWSAAISYTTFFGAGRYNLVRDRDFVSTTIKYSF